MKKSTAMPLMAKSAGEKMSCPFERSLMECSVPGDVIYLHAMNGFSCPFSQILSLSRFIKTFSKFTRLVFIQEFLLTLAAQSHQSVLHL